MDELIPNTNSGWLAAVLSSRVLSVALGSVGVGFSSVMNRRVRLVRLAPFTVAVGRAVCLFMGLMGARKV